MWGVMHEPQTCIGCGEQPAVDLAGLCGHCHWAIRAEVEEGMGEIGQYLGGWARFREWEAHGGGQGLESLARDGIAQLGGYLEARRVHDVCAERGVPVWCGGMLETGLGRAANVALAALPHFTLPGDTSASGRYYAQDITEPFVLRDGRLEVPRGPGLGVTPIPEILDELTTSVVTELPARPASQDVVA